MDSAGCTEAPMLGCSNHGSECRTLERDMELRSTHHDAWSSGVCLGEGCDREGKLWQSMRAR